MFVEIHKDKVRNGLLGLRNLFDEYAPLVSFEIRCVGLMVDDEMVGTVVYGGGRIFALGVSEDHRGCGYGRRLFEYVLNVNGDRCTTIYIPKNYHKSVAAFISWGCYFEGFFSKIDGKTKCYRIIYNEDKESESVDYYDEKLWHDTTTLASEAVVAYNVGSVL
tara:strand:+ start:568 stop:1056 length:489 start_codon:yes stop_codon:yes gene_type:complete